MAVHNEILTGRHNRFLQKLFGMKGGPPAAQLSSEIQTVHPLFHGAENRYLESWNRFGSAALAPAIAAQNSVIQFRNPPTSGVIAVIERLDIFEGVADQILISYNTGDPQFAGSAGNAIRSLDNRAAKPGTGSIGSAAAVFVGNNLAAIGGIIFRIFNQANVLISLLTTSDHQLPVLPNDSLYIFATNVNVAMVANFLWRERVLEDSELK